MTSADENYQKLIAILQSAYSGELAAAYAYRGHWHSVSAADERESPGRSQRKWRTLDLPKNSSGQIGYAD